MTRRHINCRHIFIFSIYLFASITVDKCHAWFHLYRLCRAVSNGNEAKGSKYEYMHPPGIEPTTLAFMRVALNTELRCVEINFRFYEKKTITRLWFFRPFWRSFLLYLRYAIVEHSNLYRVVAWENLIQHHAYNIVFNKNEQCVFFFLHFPFSTWSELFDFKLNINK